MKFIKDNDDEFYFYKYLTEVTDPAFAYLYLKKFLKKITYITYVFKKLNITLKMVSV
jgi:hypothetical protein